MLVLSCAASAWAVDLRNEDSRRYEAKIHSVRTTNTSIEQHHTDERAPTADRVVRVGKVKAKRLGDSRHKDGRSRVR